MDQTSPAPPSSREWLSVRELLLTVERTLADSIDSGAIEAHDRQVIGMPSALINAIPGGARVEAAMHALTAARWLIDQAVHGRDLPGTTLKRAQQNLALAGGYVAIATAMEIAASATAQNSAPGSASLVGSKAAQAAPAQHVCVACKECGRCSCRAAAGPGECEVCRNVRLVQLKAADDIARYKGQLEAGHTYVLTTNRLHRWDCRSLPSVESCLTHLDFLIRRARKAGNENEARHLDWGPLPVLLTPQELRKSGSKRRSCGMCSPDPPASA